MTNPLPALADGLTPSATTSQLLTCLTKQYQERGKEFAQSRLVLEAWAESLAQGSGQRVEIQLTLPNREIPITELFAGMDQEQARRFLGELFTDIIPHLENQQRFMQDLARGETRQGAQVNRSGITQRLASLLGEMGERELNQTATTVANALTWVDDGLRTIDAQVEFEVSLNPGRTRRGSGGISF